MSNVMPFDSESARRAGKKSSRKGIPNSENKPLREAITAFLDENFSEFEKRMKEMPAADYCDVFLKLMEYRLPKLQRSEMSIDVSNLDEAAVDRLLDQALEKLQFNEQ